MSDNNRPGSLPDEIMGSRQPQRNESRPRRAPAAGSVSDPTEWGPALEGRLQSVGDLMTLVRESPQPNFLTE